MNVIMPALYSLHCILDTEDPMHAGDVMAKLVESAKVDIWNLMPCLVDELGESHISPDRMQLLFSDKLVFSRRNIRDAERYANPGNTEPARSQLEHHSSTPRVLAIFPITKDGGEVINHMGDLVPIVQSERYAPPGLSPLLRQDEDVDPTIPSRWLNDSSGMQML